jgi:hypothetical protein
MGFEIKKKEKIVHVATKMADDSKSITEFHVEKTKAGWHIEKWFYDVEQSAVKTEIYLPDELFESIIIPEYTKLKLNNS